MGLKMQTMRMISGAMALAFMALPAAAQLPRPGQLPPPSSPKAPPAPPPAKAAPQAQQKITPPAPYTPLKVAPPKPYEDPSLAVFRKDLAAAVQKKDRAALSKLVLAQGFFWLKEEGNAAGKKSGIEVLATALNLAAKDGSGWDSLSEFANDETAAPYPDRPNTVCSPAGPQFNPPDLEKLAEATKTDVGDWGFLSQDGTEVHASAQTNSPVIDKLGMHFIRVMPDTAPNASQEMMRIVAPSGKVGFIAAEAISPLGSDQLCYGKDAAGAWKIVGMIGGE
jgi:hypothetical protein